MVHCLACCCICRLDVKIWVVKKSCLTSPTQQVTSRFTDSLKRAPFYISNEQLNKRWGSDLHFVSYWRCVFMSFNLIALQKQFREVFLSNGCVVVLRIEIPRMPKYNLKKVLWTHMTLKFCIKQKLPYNLFASYAFLSLLASTAKINFVSNILSIYHLFNWLKAKI